ncbi:signaling protein [Niabella ginsenosidivorans]|uniref:Signaling protein n=1 Tax=Niabella ginsenosidivorans TaxID=1176587 RepID=A0A1A9I9M9_9BACT|nr:PDZ domain-containing protein [Niabella ginsenosidivorans]ANH83381.1 signaling protein [Niabella ginsenosidivorans]
MRSYYFLFALLLPGFGWAQSDNQNKEAEQIIITKKGTADGRMNIVVDGDKVTVNGKPVDTDKDADISVQRKKIKDLDVYNDDDGQFGRGRSFNNFNGTWQQMPAPNKAMLGVVTQKTDDGVTVINVTGESAADKAGLKEGDIITQVDGTTITTPDGLSSAIKDKDPGDKVSITYKRDGKTFTTSATLTKWKAPEGNGYFNQGNGNTFSMPPMDLNELFRQMPNQGRNRNYRFYSYPDMDSDSPKIGIRIQELDKGDGVKILEVEKGSDADKAGLKSGDIIKEINGRTINSTDNAGRVIRDNRKSSLEFKINRNGHNQTITVTQPSRIKTADL